MRARLSAFALTLIALALASSSVSADQFVPVAVTPNVTPATTSSADGLKAPKGDTSFGSSNSTLSGGDNPSASVNVNVNVHVNSSWVGQEYTNKDGTASSNPCYGSKFRLTQSYIEAHEQEHVRQIADDIRQFFRDNSVTYRPSTNEFRFGGLTTNAADIQAKINKHVQDEVNDIGKQDQNEYAAHDAGGNFGGLEGGARTASCNEFMQRIGNTLLGLMGRANGLITDVNNLLKEAQSQANSAGDHAAKALQAAKDALDAAKKCDWDAFKKALDKYKAEMEAAQTALDASDHALNQANDGQHAGQLNNLGAQYDNAKAQAGVIDFKAKLPNSSQTADGVRSNIDKTLRNLAAQTTAINAQNAATRGKLKKAKDLMDEAWKELLAMKWPKLPEPKWDTKAAYDAYEKKNGYAPTPKPSPTPTPTPTPQPSPTEQPTDKPVGEDSQFNPAQPQPGDGTGHDQGVNLSPIAGPHSEIVATVYDPNEAGPHAYIVAVVDSKGHRTFWRGVTDQLGKLHLRLPDGIAVLELFRRFDRSGKPDVGSSCNVGNPPHLPGTQPIPNVPNTNPAVLEGDTAYQQGGSDQGIFDLHTRGNNPLGTHVLLDGKSAGVKTLAASDNSVVGQIQDSVVLGRHTFAIESNGKRSNAFGADVVTLTAEPLPPSQPGVVQTVRVHVNGIPQSDSATMTFTVTGASQIAGGGTSATVPVTGGVAEVQIRGVHAGRALVEFNLKVVLNAHS